jgi:hypothetical protein
LEAGIAAVPTSGTLGLHQARLIQTTQEPLRSAEYLRSPAHRVRGVILIVELVGRVRGGLSTSASRGAPARQHQGPRVVGFHHHYPTVRSASCIRVHPTGRPHGDRCSITENHLPI